MTSTSHRLRTSEVYYLLEGEKGVMHIGGESAKVKKCQAIYIPPNSMQYIHNSGKEDLILFCIVDPVNPVKHF